MKSPDLSQIEYPKKQVLLFFCFLIFIAVNSFSQDTLKAIPWESTLSSGSENKSAAIHTFNRDSLKSPYDDVTLGFGLGMDYGGFGMKATYYPLKNVGIFGGIGYAIIGPGYNLGLKLRAHSSKNNSHVSPYLIAMYGYNAVIKVQNASQFDNMFFGPTFGLGLDFRKRRNTGYWAFAVLIPVRGSEVQSYISDLKKNHGVVFKNDLFPFGISIGYNFIMSKKY